MKLKRILAALLAAVTVSVGIPSAFAADTGITTVDGITLTEGAMLRIDGDRLVLLDGEVSADELLSSIEGSATLVSPKGESKTGSTLAASDDTVTAGGESLTLLFFGDTDRNGRITLLDASAAMKHIARWGTDICTAAADVDANGTVNLADASKLLRAIAGWEDISLGNVRMVAENVPLSAEADDADLQIFFDHTLSKQGRSDTTHTGKHTFKMKMARREYESCQMYITTTADKEGLSIEITPFVHEFGGAELESEILRGYYYKLDMYTKTLAPLEEREWISDFLVDPLPPVPESFELTADRSQVFVINALSDENSPAGMYRATVSVKDSADQVIKCAYVYAYVWDFTLPVTPYSESAFGTGSKYHDQYPEYYEFMLEQNISPYRMPYLITDERADSYMSDPRCTSFIIAGSGNGGVHDRSDEEIINSYKKLQTNKDWLYKGYFYSVDEPTGDGWQAVRDQYEKYSSLVGDPNINVVLPIASNAIIDPINVIDGLEFVKGYINIWVPQSRAFMQLKDNHYYDPPYSPRRVVNTYGETRDRLLAFKELENNRLWWYICCQPQFPYPNYFECYSGVMNRVVLWQQYYFDIDGLLYWAVSNWTSVTRNKTQGDGCLIYWKELFGFSEGGPVSSYRMVQVRDSFDDFDYMKIAEELCGRDAVMEIVSTVTTGVVDVNEDPAAMIAARDAIVRLILENK